MESVGRCRKTGKGITNSRFKGKIQTLPVMSVIPVRAGFLEQLSKWVAIVY